MKPDTICELCLASWHFAFEDENTQATCGHENWFLAGSYCMECSRIANKCQCCGEKL